MTSRTAVIEKICGRYYYVLVTDTVRTVEVKRHRLIVYRNDEDRLTVAIRLYLEHLPNVERSALNAVASEIFKEYQNV